ncbi:MAG: hypothetical protein AB7E80_17595 [Hyphomicrobiaceae bacterium]
MLDEEEQHARHEASQLMAEYGAEASLYAALKAQQAIERRDYRRCAKWRRVLEILSTEKRDTTVSNYN